MKNRITSAILAFFLGGIGVHRFYLGQGGLGILYLLFCWTFVPLVVSFIDFLAFLLMSDDAFNMKYNRTFIQMSPAQPNIIIQNVQGDYHSKSDQSTPSNYASNQTATTKENPFKINGDKKYAEYDFDGAIKEYQRSLNVKANDPEVHFKLACLYSLLEQTNSSLFHLSKAVEQGFINFAEIKNHDHLAHLRSTTDYDKFVNNHYKIGISEPPLQLLPTEDVISKIEKLAALKDKGVLSEGEFNTQKGKLLGH